MTTKIDAQLEAARIQAIVVQAKIAAKSAAETYLRDKLQGRDVVAWTDTQVQFRVRIAGVKGNTKLGKALKDCGFSKAYAGGMEIWNPSGLPVQNMDVKMEGAEAFAKVLIDKLGLGAEFKVLAECRMV